MSKQTHFDHLLEHTPDLASRKILDIGSGKGAFLVDAAGRSSHVTGLELFDEYIKKAHDRARENGVSIAVEQGVAEHMPFTDNEFGFANMSELIEHVDDPEQTLQEVYRVLQSGGKAYMSVPNRFGWYDPHFHIYGINWLPRFCANPLLSILKKHKNYSHDAGRQKLTEMHYYRYGTIKRMCEKIGFTVYDIRVLKLQRMFKNKLIRSAVLCMYIPARAVYFNTAHLLLEK